MEVRQGARKRSRVGTLRWTDRTRGAGVQMRIRPFCRDAVVRTRKACPRTYRPAVQKCFCHDTADRLAFKDAETGEVRAKAAILSGTLHKESPRSILGGATAEPATTEVAAGSLASTALPQYLSRQRQCDAWLRQRSQFASRAIPSWARAQQITLDVIRPGEPVDNAYVESPNGKLRDECLNEQYFRELTDARVRIEHWRREYNRARL